MNDRELFEEFEVQDDHVENLEVAVAESQGRLSVLHDKVKHLLKTKYRGKGILAISRVYFLNAHGILDSREIARPDETQAMSESDIDRIMCADWQPRFGFGPFSHREPVYIGWDEEHAVMNGETS